MVFDAVISHISAICIGERLVVELWVVLTDRKPVSAPLVWGPIATIVGPGIAAAVLLVGSGRNQLY
jgi:hypothetical protein